MRKRPPKSCLIIDQTLPNCTPVPRRSYIIMRMVPTQKKKTAAIESTNPTNAMTPPSAPSKTLPDAMDAW